MSTPYIDYIACRLPGGGRYLQRSEEGQTALEYIAVVVGLVVLVALGFLIAGNDIREKASTFVQDVVSEAGG